MTTPPTQADVRVYRSPWASGTRVVHYHGPVVGRIEGEMESLEKLIAECLAAIKDRCLAESCTDIVDFQTTVRLLEERRLEVSMIGTAAVLEPLFGGPMPESDL